MNRVLWVGVMLLLVTACGQAGITSAPELTMQTPTSLPEPGVIPTENLANGSVPERFNKYIGSTHPPYPEGLSDDFAMLIQDAEDHALTLVSDNPNKMLWLSKLTHYDSNGTAYWEVKDVLDLSNAEAGLILVPDGCSLNGRPDSEIIVTSKDGTIQMAWRANTTLDRFEVIPSTGIECRSDKAMNIS